MDYKAGFTLAKNIMWQRMRMIKINLCVEQCLAWLSTEDGSVCSYEGQKAHCERIVLEHATDSDMAQECMTKLMLA